MSKTMEQHKSLKTGGSFFILIFAFFSGLPLLIISLMIHLNPSGVGPVSPFINLAQALLTGLGMGLFTSIITLITLFSKRQYWFILLIIVNSLLAILSGQFLHQDYFTYLWEAIVLVYIVFIWRLDLFIKKVDFHTVKPYVIISLVLYCVIALWEILMGYAIVTRQEPRYIESIYYNIYNSLLAQVLLIRILTLRNALKDRLTFDGVDFHLNGMTLRESIFLTDTENLLLAAFWQNRKNYGCANCRDILGFMATKKKSYKSKLKECEINCTGDGDYTPSCCGVFSSLRSNQFASLNQKLQIARLGRIRPAGTSQKRIREDGWKVEWGAGIKVDI